MKLIKIKIRRFKELVTGILMRSGAKWSLIRLNAVDYVLDGFQFTNKEYIACESEIKEDTILHRILSIKNKKDNISPIKDTNILDDNNLLYSSLKRDEMLVAVCLHREDVLYVGKIKDVGEKSFILKLYNTDLQNCGAMKIDFVKVRYIQIHTDYLDSLCLLLDS